MGGCETLFPWSCTIQLSDSGKPQFVLDFSADFTSKIDRWDAKDMIESGTMLNKLFNIPWNGLINQR